MVSSSNLVLGGLAILLLGFGASRIFRTNGSDPISQSEVSIESVSLPEPIEKIVNPAIAETQGILSEAKKLLASLIGPIVPQRSTTQRAILTAPVGSLSDAQILGQRRTVASFLASGGISRTGKAFTLGRSVVGRASMLTTGEKAQRNIGLGNVQTELRDFIDNLTNQLKILQADSA